MNNPSKQIRITYTNHRGETAVRTIEPQSIWFGSTQWHPEQQWLLKAHDVDKNEERDFAVLSIAEFKTGELSAAVPAAVSVSEAKMYADGGSRGNPGPSASGYVLLDMEDNVVKKEGVYVGVTTNNQAEYKALLIGLQNALELNISVIHVYMDSLLVVNQINGDWKIKHQELIPIWQSIRDLLPKFESITVQHVPRALNKLADKMVNECLDAQ